MAGFEVITYGRFWVIAKDKTFILSNIHSSALKRLAPKFISAMLFIFNSLSKAKNEKL
jgi:hypothetical protein